MQNSGRWVFQVENWVVGNWSILLKDIQPVRDRSGCQIPGFSRPCQCFLLQNGTCLRRASCTHPSAWDPSAAQPFPSHTNPRAAQDGEGPQTRFFLPISPPVSPWHKTLLIYQKEKNAILCSWIAGNEHAAKITGTVQHHPRRQPAPVRGSALQAQRDVLPRIAWWLLARLPMMGFPKWFPEARPLRSELRKKLSFCPKTSIKFPFKNVFGCNSALTVNTIPDYVNILLFRLVICIFRNGGHERLK